MTAIHSFDEDFREFSKMTQPRDAGKVQQIETKRAFMAGGYAMLMLCSSISSDRTEDEAVVQLESLRRELESFFAALAKTN